MSSRILSAALVGIEAAPVEIESDVANGLPAFVIVGLPDAAVQESRERVKSALKNCGYGFPKTRLTVNLAPADVRKAGPVYDLPIAVSVMVAAGELKRERVEGTLFIGELALDGALRPVDGVLAATLLARKLGLARVCVPTANAAEASLVDGVETLAAPSLAALVRHLRDEDPLMAAAPPAEAASPTYPFDFADVRGLAQARRAMEIAAAGAHNILLSGSPGAGKTLLARALPSILPPLGREERLEVALVRSAAGLMSDDALPAGRQAAASRPWRAPHHTASAAAIIGGGSNPRPGEVTLAHRGVLFLDEFPEFARPVLEGLRQPLEDRHVTVSRVSGAVDFPADFMLVAAKNPCPCGYFGDPERVCDCPAAALLRYRKRISGPLMDRIDLYVDVPRTPYEELSCAKDGEASASVRKRVSVARERQRSRGVVSNAALAGSALREACVLPPEADRLLRQAARTLKLSPRAIHRCLKVARTIADLAGRDRVEESDVAEALQYRPRTE